jgi:hypothetical protein
MSADTESFLFDSHGPVNTGTGPQINGTVFSFDSLERLVRVGRDPRVVAHEHLHWLNQRFVEPGHYGRARELLADSGSVLLTGAPGSGRRATAQILLHRLNPDNAELIRELPDADTGGPSDGPVLDAQVVDSGQRLLLDLSTSEETYCEVVLGQLPSYRAEVQERGAHLVVVLPRSREHHFGSELGPSVVEIVRREGKGFSSGICAAMASKTSPVRNLMSMGCRHSWTPSRCGSSPSWPGWCATPGSENLRRRFRTGCPQHARR